MTDDSLPEPDRIEGAPHPRETLALFGQQAAEATFLDAYATGRLHHGWLLTGPRGVGKATLAWRIARFLLATPPAEGGGLFGDPPPPPDTLAIGSDHPVARRMMAGAEPGLFVLRRGPNDKGDRLSADIRVDEVRKLKGFLHLSAADGGRRVVIVDAADELNVAAANALLKLLEEPPAGATLLLISHQPSGLLPTIRSRCRELRLSPLSPDDLAQALNQAGAGADDSAALAVLATGSAGEAIRLSNLDGLRTYARIVALFASLPRLDRQAALALADSAAQRGAGESRLGLILMLMDLFLSRLARSGIVGAQGAEAAPGEAALFARLCPSPRAARIWANLHQTLGARARHGQAVNLDPAALLLDMIFRIDQTASQLALSEA
ncbi:MAG TPA: DNA polymerase III subunit delta' [Paracoccaceae bacterium]|nr:DNA polymerase III subunit delta' [Paracoccaceae bacterium]